MKTIEKIYTFLIFAFLYAPIAVMIIYSFNGVKSRSVFSCFSLQWYQELFSDSVIMKSLYISLLTAVLAAV
ncbi:MAG: ABC transporter permease, partial [Clostridiales bacterium]|nr:ABC transporter permease [Clostridiales bacterium]